MHRNLIAIECLLVYMYFEYYTIVHTQDAVKHKRMRSINCHDLVMSESDVTMRG